MNNIEFEQKVEFLINSWCSRKELTPLRRILNGHSALNGLTDGWEEMLLQLKTIRAQNKKEIKDEELNIIIELIHATESALE